MVLMVAAVSSPVLVPLRLLPVTVPVAATLVGVMSPRPNASVPEAVIGPPETVMPLLPVADTDVTVPVPALNATVDRLVTRPLASTVITGIDAVVPYTPGATPVLLKTVANVPVPEPVTSPVSVMV